MWLYIKSLSRVSVYQEHQYSCSIFCIFNKHLTESICTNKRRQFGYWILPELFQHCEFMKSSFICFVGLNMRNAETISFEPSYFGVWEGPISRRKFHQTIFHLQPKIICIAGSTHINKTSPCDICPPYMPGIHKFCGRRKVLLVRAL